MNMVEGAFRRSPYKFVTAPAPGDQSTALNDNPGRVFFLYGFT